MCLTLCNPTDCSLPGSSIHGIFQAIVLEWIARDPGSVLGLVRSAGEGIGYSPQYSWASLVAQLVKNPPAMRETWVQSLGWEGPLEKEMAIHSSTIAWKIPWIEEPGRLQSMGSQRVGCD